MNSMGWVAGIRLDRLEKYAVFHTQNIKVQDIAFCVLLFVCSETIS